jgi:hypothetical protein
MNTGHEVEKSFVPSSFLVPFLTALAEAKTRFRAYTGRDQADIEIARRGGYIGGHEAEMQIARLSDPQRFEKRAKTSEYP